MRNKKLVYVMLVVVLLIWSLIVYRIYDGVSKKKGVYTEQSNDKKASLNLLKDSFSIVVNYRDPFLGTMVSPVPKGKSLVIKKKTKVTEELPRVVVEKVAVIWPNLKYIGLITNQNKGKQLAILTIRGKEFILRESESIEGVTLFKAYKDSIIVLYANDRKVLYK